jgi:ABC-type multidrug transport system ATPase subunit
LPDRKAYNFAVFLLPNVFMRESVLLALIHIFAIVSTVNPGGITSRGKKILRSYLRRYLNRELEEEYFALFENNLEFYSNELKSVDKDDLADEDSLISFQITNICRQIKKGLFLEERMIVFLQLLEFAFEDGQTSEQEMTIIDIVSRTFAISKKEYDNACAFMIGRKYDLVSSDCLLLIEGENADLPVENDFKNYDNWRHLKIKGFKGQLFVLHIESTGSLLMTYDGPLGLYFKGRDIIACRPYLLDRGVNIKGAGIDVIYYSKVYKTFISDNFKGKIIFEAHNINYQFKNSDNGIKPMNFRIESGNLVGIMGGSGVGKTTLLNVLNGKLIPNAGNIYINGYDIHEESEAIKGLIGFVPQEDMLAEELTVYQNMYYNARLCFSDYTEEELNNLVDEILIELDLYDIKDLQVGDLLNKKVSGGQRKRLNIGLELMREPVVLFVDEPTSGLSSHDSERVMALLRQQALSGKLVITNIHQPSSNILKMFDRLWLLDKGGYMIYDGDAVEALVYFKTETSQANAAESECPNCGNIETENILHIIEVKVIDSAGYPGKERQINPEEWYEKYKKKMIPIPGLKPFKTELPPSNFKVPRKIKQITTFLERGLSRKLADKQYMIINLLEAPFLAVILSYLTKYSADGIYLFSKNKNYPQYLFMAVVVALFLGLMVSAEELFKDRKIIEREKFLNLSRLSYLISKVSFLFILSAIQSLLFVVVSILMLEVRGMLWQQWLILFTTACYGNLVGLNISAGMRTAVSIYILIPLILVPQLLLGGAMIKFDDLHKSISNKIYVPLIGDLMATRWAYEAIAVEGFKDNRYEKPLFKYNMEMSQNTYYIDILIPDLKVQAIDYILQFETKPDKKSDILQKFRVLNYHIKDLSNISGLQPGVWFKKMNYNDFTENVADSAKKYLEKLRYYFIFDNKNVFNELESRKIEIIKRVGPSGIEKVIDLNHNESLTDLVRDQTDIRKKPYYETKDRWIQKTDPIFMMPGSNYGRAHFYAPYKLVGDLPPIGTLLFNILAIWFMVALFFVTLYYNMLKRFIDLLEALRLPIWRKFGRQIN